MLTSRQTPFHTCFAETDADIAAAQALRRLAFFGDGAATLDNDAFDAQCRHVLIEDAATNQLVCCFRLMNFNSGADITKSYAAQYYDLTKMSGFEGAMCEIGRFCLHPDRHDPDILRLAWSVLTRHVDAKGIQMLFGCSSFAGINPAPFADAFALLADRYIAPAAFSPHQKAASIYEYATDLRDHPRDPKAALTQMPSLLRTYLMMGGWVSDHAVIDSQMNTLHVFTGLEIATIPAARARQLRRDAAINH